MIRTKFNMTPRSGERLFLSNAVRFIIRKDVPMRVNHAVVKQPQNARPMMN